MSINPDDYAVGGEHIIEIRVKVEERIDGTHYFARPDMSVMYIDGGAVLSIKPAPDELSDGLWRADGDMRLILVNGGRYGVIRDVNGDYPASKQTWEISYMGPDFRAKLKRVEI